MGGSEGGRNDRERRRERGWREGKVLQLYPELQGSQEFHPWKSFFLSLSGKFCKHFSTQLLFTNISTFHAVLHMKTDSTLQSYALFFSLSLPEPPSHHPGCQNWASNFHLPQSWQTEPSQQHRGGWGHCLEEVASPGMHGSRHDQTCSV